jgi:hypothetical protein
MSDCKHCEVAESYNFTSYSGTKLCLSQEQADFENKEFYSHINYAIIRQGRRCKYTLSVEGPSRNHCCPRKAISITYSTCVSLTLIIQHA